MIIKLYDHTIEKNTFLCDGKSYKIKRRRYRLKRGPNQILGIIKINSKLTFIVKWTNSDETVDLIDSKEFNEKWPNLVLNYYQARLIYTTSRGEERTMG
jgi:hypothetical protein